MKPFFVTRHSAGLCVVALTTACASYHSLFRDERVRTVPEADFRQPNTQVELAYGNGYYLANSWRSPNQAYGRSRPYVLVTAGNPTPIAAWSNKALGDTSQPAFVPYTASFKDARRTGGDTTGQWTVQLTVPIAFYLFWDAFTENNPIVNTDYTFGFDVSGRWAMRSLTEQRFGVYWGHISTHLGDEYVISGRQASGRFPFPRVNVSMFPWRMNGSQRWYSQHKDPTGARSYFQVAGQLEGPCVVCHDTAYYYTYTSETQGVPIPIIPPGLEFTATADLRILHNTFQVNRAENRANLEPSSINVGILVGNRRIFPYLPTTTARYGLVSNVTGGYRFPATNGPGVNYVEVFGRLYHGPNPYGQLRNQSKFTMFSVGAKILH